MSLWGEHTQQSHRRTLAYLLLQRDDVIKVGVVDVSVDPKQPLQDGLGNGNKVPWERCSWREIQNTLTPHSIATLTNFGGKDSFIVQLVLDPCHKVVNVLGGRALDWLLHRCTISPMILIPGGR